MKEEWRPTHHPDYDVSNLGRVRSRAPMGRPDISQRPKEPRILKPVYPSHGYACVNFGEGNSQRVHRLVLIAFVGLCPPGSEALHADDNPRNPALYNLSWNTHRQNLQDAVRRGRHQGPHKVLYA